MHTIFWEIGLTFDSSNKTNLQYTLIMEKEFKKFLYAGVDLAAAASEKFQSTVTDLVSKGKISSEEGKKLVDDFFAKSEERKAEFEKKYKEFSDKLGINKKKNEEEELEELRKKVSDLEAKLSKTKTAAAK